MLQHGTEVVTESTTIEIACPGFGRRAKAANIFSGKFDASEMKHAIRHEIHIKLEENPAYYQSRVSASSKF